MKKLLNFTFSLLVISLIYLQSCTYSVEPPTYNREIKQIFDTYCVSGCHIAGGMFSSVPLNTFADVQKYTKFGKVIQTMNQDGSAPSMPFGQLKLPQALIDKVKNWQKFGCPE